MTAQPNTSEHEVLPVELELLDLNRHDDMPQHDSSHRNRSDAHAKAFVLLDTAARNGGVHLSEADAGQLCITHGDGSQSVVVISEHPDLLAEQTAVKAARHAVTTSVVDYLPITDTDCSGQVYVTAFHDGGITLGEWQATVERLTGDSDLPRFHAEPATATQLRNPVQALNLVEPQLLPGKRDNEDLPAGAVRDGDGEALVSVRVGLPDVEDALACTTDLLMYLLELGPAAEFSFVDVTPGALPPDALRLSVSYLDARPATDIVAVFAHSDDDPRMMAAFSALLAAGDLATTVVRLPEGQGWLRQILDPTATDSRAAETARSSATDS
ncbi:hypothetical protein CLV92_12011 [Kineococcus xinjiangensis]|uniref:Uncharacterized protein n=1 Tax=Kineococcus xinjiangensis TaxID=512762 RepID=A0A2S6ICE0_9ACTN|nr:hypothetical protein [Kineococcus xinjiangensis]PPK91892.1 hypothetical protein CLV92_12011 [Kineococcus xinjiangensis]